MYKMKKLTKEVRTTESKVQSHVQEYLQHRTLISTLEYTSRVTGALASLQTNLKRQIIERTNFSLFSRTMVQAGFAIGYFVAFLWGVMGLRAGAVTFGMMTAFLQLVAQMQRPMVELSRQLPAFVHVMTSCERLSDLTDLPLEEKGTPIKLDGEIGISVKDLTFAYPGNEQEIIKHFNISWFT